MWKYFATRRGAEGLVEILFRSNDPAQADLYNREIGWTPNFKRFAQLRASGDLDSSDLISEEQALQIIRDWQLGQPAMLQPTQAD